MHNVLIILRYVNKYNEKINIVDYVMLYTCNKIKKNKYSQINITS